VDPAHLFFQVRFISSYLSCPIPIPFPIPFPILQSIGCSFGNGIGIGNVHGKIHPQTPRILLKQGHQFSGVEIDVKMILHLLEPVEGHEMPDERNGNNQRNWPSAVARHKLSRLLPFLLGRSAF